MSDSQAPHKHGKCFVTDTVTKVQVLEYNESTNWIVMNSKIDNKQYVNDNLQKG